MLELRNRPIRAIERDERLWVPRPADVVPIERGIGLGFNVLVVGQRGAGVTSLLNQVAGWAAAHDRRVAQISARRMDSAAALLDAVTDSVLVDEDLFPERPRPGDAAELAYRRLSSVADAHPNAVVFVDDVTGRLGHDVFGRMRDELWTLELQWVVAVPEGEQVVLLTPPADAFFETVHHVRPFEAAQAMEMLERRDPDGDLAPDVRRAIVDRSDGTPGSVLDLARRAIQSDDPLRELSQPSLRSRVRSDVSEPALRLFEELSRIGTAGPSDERLLQRLAWTRSRAYQVFAELEEAGYITVAREHDGQPGRPRKVYRLAEGAD